MRSTGSSSAGGDSDGITVYNAQHENLPQAWAEEFTQETGIAVEMRNGSDNELANQLILQTPTSGTGQQQRLAFPPRTA